MKPDFDGSRLNCTFYNGIMVSTLKITKKKILDYMIICRFEELLFLQKIFPYKYPYKKIR